MAALTECLLRMNSGTSERLRGETGWMNIKTLLLGGVWQLRMDQSERGSFLFCILQKTFTHFAFFLLHSFHMLNFSDFIHFHKGFFSFLFSVFSFLCIFSAILISLPVDLIFFTPAAAPRGRDRCFTALLSSTFKYTLFYVGGSCARL